LAPTDPAARGRGGDAALIERYRRSRDPRDLEALVQRFHPLALHLAHHYGTSHDREDLEQVASLALVKAITRFDPARGVAFATFAVPTILGELKRYFRDLGWSVRVPRALQELAAEVDRATEEVTRELGRTGTTEEVAERCGVSAERVLEARTLTNAHFADSLDRPRCEADDESEGAAIGGEDPEFERAEQRVDVEWLLSRLTPREALVVRLRFEQDLVQREIAARVGLSQMQVSRLLSRAVIALRDHADETACGREAAVRP
jgi:RNA polymerase sigma-B factor